MTFSSLTEGFSFNFFNISSLGKRLSGGFGGSSIWMTGAPKKILKLRLEKITEQKIN